MNPAIDDRTHGRQPFEFGFFTFMRGSTILYGNGLPHARYDGFTVYWSSTSDRGG